MIPYGYGKILDVNLSAAIISTREVTPEFAAAYVGGIGFGLKILYDEVKPGVDPLGPENIVVFAVGPLTGTVAPCSGRVEITNKSPLTGHIGTGNAGGVWPAFLKFSGYDVIIIRGRSSKPVYLFIDGDTVELREAGHLWGKETQAASDILTQEISPAQSAQVSVMTIGPAGENLVKFACPLNDYHHVAARGGAGAVLGSKKLKAIAIRRKRSQVQIAQDEAFIEAVRESRKRLQDAQTATAGPEGQKKPGFVLDDARKSYVARGCLPGKNFQTGTLPDWYENLGRPAALKYITGSESNCFACPMPCFDLAEVKEGRYTGTRVTRGSAPGLMFDIAAKCAIDNIPAVFRFKELCQNYGLDYGSTAGVIAFAQELFQRQIITARDTDGRELAWGHEENIIELVHQIAKREGFGNVLAEGSVGAAKIIGREAEKYVMCIKGLEAMTGDPRSGKKGFHFGEITNPRGGDNIKSTHFRADSPDQNWPPEKIDIFAEEKKRMYCAPLSEISDTWAGKPLMTKWFEDLYSVCNSLGVCFFPAGFKLALGPTHYAKLYGACIGRQVTPEEMMKLGEKIFNLLKAYTVREGLTRKDDCWADRFYDEQLPEGPAQGAVLSRVTLNGLLDEYYAERGWDQELGVPSSQRLIDLGLEEIATDLVALGLIKK